jgi:eukaryotic-like serine/threonine-protein kinase
MEGQVLGNRYELIEKIGGGGMALVYKARCQWLNRFVAVKILRPEFINDEEFVKRFRVEAQSAASLSHPNVVSIYDVGQQDHIHFIVMEYIDGITLKEYIAQKSVLNWEEAVKITIQICSAIEHAHRNHIVHRDIKPHNILLTRDGIAKVTDFGIARAVSSSTITMVGCTIGSVHYFSPEQARGGFTDEKSDLYSIGIALYEMVTGKVPFDGETPVAVALMHIQNQAEPPIEVNETIPTGVNGIILKAIQKEQAKRYQAASDMLKDLYKVLREPDMQVASAGDAAESSPTRRLDVIDDVKLNNMIKGNKDMKNKGKDPEKDKTPHKNDKLTYWLAGITSLIIIAVFGFLAYNFVFAYIIPIKDSFEVQYYVGKNFQDVKKELEAEGIEVIATRKYDDKAVKDEVMSQNIEAGRTLRVNGMSDIELVVSDGPKMVVIPSVKNIEYRQSKIDLENLDLIVEEKEEFSENIGKDLAIRTVPGADEEVKAGSRVVLYKSMGPELRPVKVPDLLGRTRAEAEQLLFDLKLKLGKVTPPDLTDSGARVISQKPAALTEILEESTVDLEFEVAEPVGQRNSTPWKVHLANEENYGDTVRVRIDIIPSDTNTVENLFNEDVEKSKFPVEVKIPVPQGGSTKFSLYFDNVLQAGYEIR